MEWEERTQWIGGILVGNWHYLLLRHIYDKVHIELFRNRYLQIEIEIWNMNRNFIRTCLWIETKGSLLYFSSLNDWSRNHVSLCVAITTPVRPLSLAHPTFKQYQWSGSSLLTQVLLPRRGWKNFNLTCTVDQVSAAVERCLHRWSDSTFWSIERYS